MYLLCTWVRGQMSRDSILAPATLQRLKEYRGLPMGQVTI